MKIATFSKIPNIKSLNFFSGLRSYSSFGDLSKKSEYLSFESDMGMLLMSEGLKTIRIK